MKSRKLTESVVVYNSVRHPGKVYTFSRKKDNEFRCCRCRELKKQRVITVVDDVVVGRKDPEDDHHPASYCSVYTSARFSEYPR